MSQATPDLSPPELAPSDTRREEPSVARVFGMFGLGCVVLGSAAVIANQYGPRWIPEGWGYLIALLGVACLFFHAARDADVEIRRIYGGFAALLLLTAVVVSLLPYRPADGAERQVGYLLLPWGAGAALLGLMFAVPFVRHETEEPYATRGRQALLGVGGLLAVGAVAAGVAVPGSLLGPALVCGLLGLGFVAAYLGNVDASEGVGYWAAVGLGAVGVAAVVLAVGQSVVPTVLYEGPAALKTPRQTYDVWKVTARVLLVLAGLGVALVGVRGRGVPGWMRGAVLVLGLAWAGVFVFASFGKAVFTPPAPYLVPSGLILGGLGLLYLGAAVGVASDSPLVVLTRRELAAYFYSPIAYIVLFGMAFVAGIGYSLFASRLITSGQPVAEPIVQEYMSLEILAAFQVVFLVPVLTMRLFSEERRTGTLEVLLTAPVNEGAVVASKFAAAWLFFMLTWLPAGLYLIALRVVGGEPFDYRPLLSYYLALGASGAGFLGMGLFFSALTKNQIIAAVLTFAGMMFLLLTILARGFGPEIGPGFQAALGKLDFLSQWRTALAGQLPVIDVLVWLSLGVFWLFLTAKVLEARKWG